MSLTDRVTRRASMIALFLLEFRLIVPSNWFSSPELGKNFENGVRVGDLHANFKDLFHFSATWENFIYYINDTYKWVSISRVHASA